MTLHPLRCGGQYDGMKVGGFSVGKGHLELEGRSGGRVTLWVFIASLAQCCGVGTYLF